ncbi:hypothetical protein PAMP_016129 [Pampus punctatissimus]
MSWEAYITNLKGIDSTGAYPVDQAAICGISDFSVWASTPGFSLSVEEIKKLAGDRKDFCQNGTHVGGVKCRLIRDNMEMEGVYCVHLKTSADGEGNSYNVCVGRTHKALIIAKGKKEANGGQISEKVFSLVDYLRKANM